MEKKTLLTVDIKTVDLPEVKKIIKEALDKIERYEKALEFYAKTPRSGLHEDCGNLARKTLSEDN
jgi:hypothetical protein